MGDMYGHNWLYQQHHAYVQDKNIIGMDIDFDFFSTDKHTSR